MFFNLAILREAILIQCSYSFRSWRLSVAQTVSVERMQGVAKYLLDVAYSRNTRLLSLQCNLWWNTNWKTKVLDWEVWSLLVYCNLCLCKAVVWDYALLMVLKYSCVLCCLSLKQDVETLALYSHYHFKLDFFQTRDKEIFRRGLAVGKPQILWSLAQTSLSVYSSHRILSETQGVRLRINMSISLILTFNDMWLFQVNIITYVHCRRSIDLGPDCQQRPGFDLVTGLLLLMAE